MKRKVIQLARKTLVVSLPQEWCLNQKVKKGDTIEVLERGIRLLIQPEKYKEGMSCEIKVPKDHFVHRHLANLYFKGYDEVKINYEDSNIINNLKENELMGYEIVEQGENYCIVKNISKIDPHSFDMMLRRTFLLIKEMGTALIDTINGTDRKEEIRTMEKNTNKFTNFCRRLLSVQGHETAEKEQYLYCLVRDLERYGDDFKYAIQENLNLKKETKEYVEEVIKFFEKFYTAYYNPTEKNVEFLYKKRKILIQKGKKMLKDKDSSFIHNILNMVVKIQDSIGLIVSLNTEKLYNVKIGYK